MLSGLGLCHESAGLCWPRPLLAQVSEREVALRAVMEAGALVRETQHIEQTLLWNSSLLQQGV